MIFTKKQQIDFVYRKKTSELSFAPDLEIDILKVSTPGFVLLDDFIFKTQSYYFSKITELFNKPRFLLHQGDFAQIEILPSSKELPQAKSFPSSRTFSTSKDFSFIKEVFSSSQDFSFIKEVFHKQKIFLYQGSFLPQAKIFPSSRKFSTSKDILFVKEGFYKPRFFFDQGRFPQAKIFLLS